MFTKEEYEKIHELVFRADYSGYKPTVKEIPNGDGKVDEDKRYAHIAPKYMMTEQQRNDLMPYLNRAHELSIQMAGATDLPIQYYPKIEYGALRVLEYPVGAISNEHEDFDLFTIMMYRDQPDKFKAKDAYSENLKKLRAFNPQVHIGQLGELVGLGQATPHEVLASDTVQHSIVYFTIPDHEAELPSTFVRGVIQPAQKVREWLNERLQRSRTEFKKY